MPRRKPGRGVSAMVVAGERPVASTRLTEAINRVERRSKRRNRGVLVETTAVIS